MTREEQLLFCKRCLNRKMDLEQGLVCNLTGEKATFQNECLDFNLDKTVIVEPLDDEESLLNDEESLQPSEIMERLSPEIIEKLKMEQNPVQGIICGLVAGIAGAILWVVFTVLTGYYIGYIALAIGAGVGLTIRKFGNGIDSSFGYWGAGISFFSVLLGCFLTSVIANNTGYFGTTLSVLDYLQAILQIFDIKILLICLSLATFEGYKLSFKKITEKLIIKLKNEHLIQSKFEVS